MNRLSGFRSERLPLFRLHRLGPFVRRSGIRLWPAFALLGSVAPTIAAETTPAPRERTSFNAGWLFTRDDPEGVGDALDYGRMRDWIMPTGADLIGAGEAQKPPRPAGNPGADVPYTQAAFDDSGWQKLNLPHDWAIAGPFDQKLPGETGKLPWAGVGWYRKHFTIDAADAGRRVFLDVDGAMAYSAFWLNGTFVGGWPYGYTSFRLDLTPYLHFGGENVLAVRLHNPPNSSRWYPGSGLYRNVWLVKTAPVHLAHWGVFVTTPRVTSGSATVNVDLTLENESASAAELVITTRIYELDAGGHRGSEPVAQSAPDEVTIDPARARLAHRANLLQVEHPKLWSLEQPQRYVAVTTVESGGRVLDEQATPFGIRTIAFDADRGFLLNGRHVPLHGVCLHHDLGALGTAINVRALERQVEILQEMGVNSIRTSHNPPAPELLEICDRRGLVVMVEAFDCWRRGKKPSPGFEEDDPHVRYDDYARVFDDWHERDLRAMVRRDRNHPSVIMWSIGNEVREQWYTDGWRLAQHLAGIVREEDRTRPITTGCNNDQAGFIGFETAVDLVGFNYKPWEYRLFHQRHPTIPVFGSETASCVSSRGEYFFPVEEDKAGGRSDFQVSSYDLYAPRWAFPPDVEFKGLDEAPYALGEYVWTGFDYLGEPTPYNRDATNLLNFSRPEERERMARELRELGRIAVPSRSSYFGIVDLAGFKKDRFYLYQARWRPELPMAHILPHWTWPERVGKVTPVMVYSSGDEAELFLNGRSLGRRRRGEFEYRFRWNDVVYEPGELRVVVYKDGARWAEATQRTAGDAARLQASADRTELTADGRDLAFVTVRITDQAGILVPRASQRVRFSVSGPGELVATDNGDATCLIAFPSPERPAFNGLVLAIVRTLPGRTGTITLRAEAEGLAPAEVTLVAR